MRRTYAAGVVLLLAVYLLGCSKVAHTPKPPDNPPAPPGGQDSGTFPKIPLPWDSGREPTKKTEVRYRLYDSPPGLKLQDQVRDLGPGAVAVIGTRALDLDVLLPGWSEQAARQALSVEGASLEGEPEWLSTGGLALRLTSGPAGSRVTVSVKVNGHTAALVMNRAARATVMVDQQYDHGWKPVTLLDSHTLPGATSIRLLFSKPVRKPEVERALLESQLTPVRGLMQWADDQTLVWQVTEMPPRLDFLLGTAHDQEGLYLPGGIPSVRVGEPPYLALVDADAETEKQLVRLPPDVLSAKLTPSAKRINLMAWVPGTNRWDWETVDLYVNLETARLESGRIEEAQPRFMVDLEHWVISPQGRLVAGLRTERRQDRTVEPLKADLTVVDIGGGRQQTLPAFIGRYPLPQGGDGTTHLAWSADGNQVIALSYKGPAAKGVDLVMADLQAGQRSVLISDLPVPAHAVRLFWSPDGRYVLAGNLLVDLRAKTFRALEGHPQLVRGAFEPGGARLIYSLQDWGPLLEVQPATGGTKPMGTGLLVDWAGRGKIYIIRWPASNTRYSPPG